MNFRISDIASSFTNFWLGTAYADKPPICENPKNGGTCEKPPTPPPQSSPAPTCACADGTPDKSGDEGPDMCIVREKCGSGGTSTKTETKKPSKQDKPKEGKKGKEKDPDPPTQTGPTKPAEEPEWPPHFPSREPDEETAPQTDCKKTPTAPGCTPTPSPVDCNKTPQHPSCAPAPQTDCKKNPTAPGCSNPPPPGNGGGGNSGGSSNIDHWARFLSLFRVVADHTDINLSFNGEYINPDIYLAEGAERMSLRFAPGIGKYWTIKNRFSLGITGHYNLVRLEKAGPDLSDKERPIEYRFLHGADIQPDLGLRVGAHSFHVSPVFAGLFQEAGKTTGLLGVQIYYAIDYNYEKYPGHFFKLGAECLMLKGRLQEGQANPDPYLCGILIGYH